MAPVGPEHYLGVYRRIAAEARVTDAEPSRLPHFLYAQYYLEDPHEVENARTNAVSRVPIRAREDAALALALRQANRGGGYDEPGWVVTAHERDGISVRKSGVTLFVPDSDLAPAAPRAPVGATVSVRFPNDRPYVNPGFYTAVGDNGPPTPESGMAVVRFYFDVGPADAPALVAALTATLGAELGAFSLKVLNHPRAYTRPDALVAYVPRAEYPLARAMVHGLLATEPVRLGARTPSLALPIAPGVAVAEEPAGRGPVRESFGQHRCALLAAGLTRAHAAGVDSAEGRLRFLLDALTAAGIDPHRPYLEPDSARSGTDPLGPPAAAARYQRPADDDDARGRTHGPRSEE